MNDGTLPSPSGFQSRMSVCNVCLFRSTLSCHEPSTVLRLFCGWLICASGASSFGLPKLQCVKRPFASESHWPKIILQYSWSKLLFFSFTFWLTCNRLCCKFLVTRNAFSFKFCRRCDRALTGMWDLLHRYNDRPSDKDVGNSAWLCYASQPNVIV